MTNPNYYEQELLFRTTVGLSIISCIFYIASAVLLIKVFNALDRHSGKTYFKKARIVLPIVAIAIIITYILHFNMIMALLIGFSSGVIGVIRLIMGFSSLKQNSNIQSYNHIPSITTTEIKYCPFCGTSILAKAEYCVNCGKQIYEE